MKVVMKTARSAQNYVTTAHPINHVLIASAINRYKRNAFFQIACVRLDFMMAIQHYKIARVIIILTKIHLLNILFIHNLYFFLECPVEC